jgi:mRNA interferase RelE/StbE
MAAQIGGMIVPMVDRSYTVEVERAALRVWEKLPHDARTRVARAIATLEHTPHPVGCRQLRSRPGFWRIRVGDYRVIYTIEDTDLLVVVVELGHRRDVYRR